MGDAQPSRLPAKLRLGQCPGGALKRTYRSDNKGGPNASVISSNTDAKTSFSSSSRRSRWRLERDENGNPISGDEEEEEQEDEDLRNEMMVGEDSAEAAILDISGGDNDDDDNIFSGVGGSNRKRLRGSEFGDVNDNFLRGVSEFLIEQGAIVAKWLLKILESLGFAYFDLQQTTIWW